MKKSTIQFTIELDNENIPQKIVWNASDHSSEKEETKSISISIWDHQQKNTLRMDLWTNDMPVIDMKRFCIELMAGMSQTIRTATGDNQMAEEISSLCDKLAKQVATELE